MHPLEADAAEFASQAHGSINQRRKYTDDPYIVHPGEVAEIVRSVWHTPEMLAACWLHDTVEDVPSVSLQDIYQRFGTTVGDYVGWLTTTAQTAGLSRAARKTADREKARLAPAQVQTIRVADMLSNVATIVEHDAKFARVYVPEKALMLQVLDRSEPSLRARAWALLDKASQELNLTLPR